jgi:hypothetical protein
MTRTYACSETSSTPRPTSDFEWAQLTMALWPVLEAKEGRPLTDCRGINRGARQIIEAVRTCEFEV